VVPGYWLCPTMSVICGFFLILSVLLGIVIGTVHGCISGAGRVLPMHPLAELMRHGFDRVWGPFLGLHSPAARILTGLHEMLDGICLLVCVLFDAFGFFGKELSSIAKALSIVTGISCMFHGTVGALINYFLHGAPGTHGHLALASGFFILLRLCLAGPETFGAQMLCAGLSFVPVAVAMFILLANTLYGQHQSLVHGERRRLHELREEAISNAYRFVSQIMSVQRPLAKRLQAMGLFSSPLSHPHHRGAPVSAPQQMQVQDNPVFEDNTPKEKPLEQQLTEKKAKKPFTERRSGGAKCLAQTNRHSNRQAVVSGRKPMQVAREARHV